MKYKTAVILMALSSFFCNCVFGFDESLSEEEQIIEPFNHDLNFEDMFGEQIDIYTGALKMAQTDILIPGNNKIPVGFSRKISGMSRMDGNGIEGLSDSRSRLYRIFNGTYMGDWNVIVPKIRTLIVSDEGWREDRCSGPIQPKSLPIQVWNLYLQKYETKGTTTAWWKGIVIEDTPVGEQPLLEPNTSPSTTLGRVTKNNWRISCDIIASDGKEGFFAESPDGLKYSFTQVVLEDEGTYKPLRPFGVPIDLAIKSYKRRQAYMWVSKIEDRFGNYVNYSYDNGDRLISIESNDGRLITIDYKSGSNLVNTVKAHGKLWSYIYDENNKLKKVVLPDDSEWAFDFSEVDFNSEYSYTCDVDGEQKNCAKANVTHPSGATLNYIFAETEIPRKLSEDPYAHHSTYNSLVEKKISGPGITDQIWEYKYLQARDIDLNNYESNVKYTSVIDPENVETTYYQNMVRGWQETSIEKIEIKKDGNLLSTTDFNYENLYSAGSSNGFNPIYSERMLIVSGVTEKNLTLGDDKYTTSYLDFNSYGVPTKTIETNNFSSNKRYAKYKFRHDTTNWLLNFPVNIQISDDDTDYKTISETTYHSDSIGNSQYANLSLPYEFKKFGIWVNRNAEYYSDGNVKKSESNSIMSDGNYKYTLFGDYKRGISQTTTLPGRYDSSNAIIGKKTVDDLGRVISVTDFNGNITRYGYDDLDRLKYIDKPEEWSDTFISWSKSESGSPERTANTCNLNLTNTGCINGTESLQTIDKFDSLFRKVLVVHTDMTSYRSKYQNYSYNYLSQPIFTSRWSETAEEENGITKSYDGLNRLQSITESHGETITYEYMLGNKLKINDANNYDTTKTYIAYGNPSYELETKIESPENVLTTQYFDILGNLREITQSGPDGTGTTLYVTEERFYDSQNNLCRVNRPDTGNVGYGYNNGGELVWVEQAVVDGITCPTKGSNAVDFSYDNLGKLYTTTYTDSTPTTTHLFDNNGNLKSLRSGDVLHSYNYNSLNLLDDELLSLDGRNFYIDYGYNASGSIKSLVYPNGDKVEYSPNSFGQATSVIRNEDDFKYANNIKYYADGSVDSFDYGNEYSHKTKLNERNIPEEIKDYSYYSTAINYHYTYDNNLNLTSIVDNVDDDFSLTDISYDGLNRLVNTQGNIGIGNSSISYDGLGNILTYNNKDDGLYYIYDQNRLKKVNSSNANIKSYDFSNGYDNRGNVIRNGHRSFSYNLANQMIGSDSNNYLYDGFSRRVKQSDSKGTSYSIYSKNGVLLYREVNVNDSSNYGDGINYIYLGKKLIAKDGVVPYHSSKSRTHFKPFGGTIEESKDDVGYAGHKFDSDLGLSYMHMRYYDPDIGRFYSNDPLGYRNVESFNRYAYANNNPYKYIDLDGRDPDTTLGQMRHMVSSGNWSQGEYWRGVNAIGHRGTQAAIIVGAGCAVATMTLAEGSVFIADLLTAEATGGAGLGVGGMGAITSVEAAAEKAEMLIAEKTEASVAKSLPDDALVVRGGANITPESIVKGTATHPSGVTGFSAQCNGGKCLTELGANVRNNQMGVTTVGDIRNAGGEVVVTSGKGNHVTVTNLDPNDASSLLSPSIPNPVPSPERNF